MAEEIALLDTGATESFIDPKTIAWLCLGTKKLPHQRTVYNVDGTLNHHGDVTHACDLMVSRGNKKIRQQFYVANLGRDRFILGYPWFRDFQPNINWANGMLRGPPIHMETLLLGTLQRAKRYLQNKQEEQEGIILAAKRTIIKELQETTLRSGETSPEMESGLVEINRTHMATEMAHCYTEEHSKQEVTLPEEFKCHMALFSDEEAKAFPPTQGEGDHKIELLETAPTSFNCKVYPLSKAEQEAEDLFLDENLAKGYIVPSHLPYGFSTFMVPKKDSKEKRYIIDYRPLNAVTRKDVTPLPNLAQCIEDLQGMEVFSKFDIR